MFLQREGQSIGLLWVDIRKRYQCQNIWTLFMPLIFNSQPSRNSVRPHCLLLTSWMGIFTKHWARPRPQAADYNYALTGGWVASVSRRLGWSEPGFIHRFYTISALPLLQQLALDNIYLRTTENWMKELQNDRSLQGEGCANKKLKCKMFCNAECFKSFPYLQI